MNPIKAPFPWFGGKSRVAHLVWERFGNPANYVEPFAGSLAVLLGRPHDPRTETVNDIDCYLANFWRALARDPEAVAQRADWPVNEADLHARHLWLVNRGEFRERKSCGGYGSQRRDHGNENSGRERIWFSPHCLRQTSLFSNVIEDQPSPMPNSPIQVE